LARSSQSVAPRRRDFIPHAEPATTRLSGGGLFEEHVESTLVELNCGRTHSRLRGFDDGLWFPKGTLPR
jgi:hypothetical protein